VVRCRPASVDLGVTALGPPELLEFLPERRDMGLCFRVGLGIAHQHTNPSHTVGVLRARRDRQRRRAAEERDELAPFHCPIPPVLPTERIAHLSYGRRLPRDRSSPDGGSPSPLLR